MCTINLIVTNMIRNIWLTKNNVDKVDSNIVPPWQHYQEFKYVEPFTNLIRNHKHIVSQKLNSLYLNAIQFTLIVFTIMLFLPISRISNNCFCTNNHYSQKFEIIIFTLWSYVQYLVFWYFAGYNGSTP